MKCVNNNGGIKDKIRYSNENSLQYIELILKYIYFQINFCL